MTTSPPRREATDQPGGPQSHVAPQSPNGPQSAAGPQSPLAPPPSPAAPQDPAAPQSPAGPERPGAPQSPAGPQSPGAPSAPGYSGPVPAGGWQTAAAPSSGALADWGPRLGATLLDALLWFIVSFLIGIVVTIASGFGTVATGSQGVATAGAVANFLIGFALYAAYTGLLMVRPGARNGQTLGKQLLGIRVARKDGRPVKLGTVAVRHWLMKYIVFGYVPLIVLYAFTLSNAAGVGALVMALLYLVTLLNYLWPLWDKENRAFHDMAASTRVVRG